MDTLFAPQINSVPTPELSWRASSTPPPPAAALLLETGGYILLETGGRILTE
jgi:hypothetical protein